MSDKTRIGLTMLALGASLGGWWLLRREPTRTFGAPIEIPHDVARQQWLQRRLAAAGGADPEVACRRALGPRPATKWTSTHAEAREIMAATNVDFGALDPGSAALTDEFCKRLELRGRCPAGTRGAWRHALLVALGHGGKRTYAGLTRRPAWRAFEDAFTQETGGAPLPLPPGAQRLAQYEDRFADCAEQHAEQIYELIDQAQTEVPF